MLKKSLLFIATILTGMMLSACSQDEIASDCDQLVVMDNWIREAPPGVKVLAGYMTLKNTGSQVITVTASQSPAFERIEFHQTVHKNGSMKMQQLPVLEIPANSELLLEPGGRHMMLFNPDRDYKNGEKIDIVLTCASREIANAEFPVKKTTSQDMPLHPHHNH